MEALRIDWMETEKDWGKRPDGFSLHISVEAAQIFLKDAFDRLPAATPDEYDYPSAGWRTPAIATPVTIAEESPLMERLADNGSARIWRSFNGQNGAFYTETGDLKAVGKPIKISYGETPYSDDEIVQNVSTRLGIEKAVKRLQEAQGDVEQAQRGLNNLRL